MQIQVSYETTPLLHNVIINTTTIGVVNIISRYKHMEGQRIKV